MACGSGNSSLVLKLLSRNILSSHGSSRPFQVNYNRSTAFVAACRSGNADVILLLLSLTGDEEAIV
jgi:ankyrin repeat protein